MRALFVIVAAAVLVLLFVTSGTISPVVPKGIPIKALGDGKPHPEILLIAPLPGWIPLPDSGSAISAGVYAPQPPYGAAAVIMVRTDAPRRTPLRTMGDGWSGPDFPCGAIRSNSI
jgi:hypothetical protein